MVPIGTNAGTKSLPIDLSITSLAVYRIAFAFLISTGTHPLGGVITVTVSFWLEAAAIKTPSQSRRFLRCRSCSGKVLALF
jgi:hypothetical protein